MAASLTKTATPFLFLRGSVYYASREVNGTEHRASLHTRDEKEAHERLRDFLNELDDQTLPTNRRIKCSTAFAQFIAGGFGPRGTELKPATIKLYEELWFAHCEEILGKLPVYKIEPKHIIRVLKAAEKGDAKKKRKPLSG